MQMEWKLTSRKRDLRALGQYQSPQVPSVVLGEVSAMTQKSTKRLKIMKGTTAPLDPNAQYRINYIPISGFSLSC